WVEPLVERGLETGDIDPEVAQQALGVRAPLCLRRVDRLAAAVADEQAPADGELVALGVAAEIIVVIEHKDARLRPGAAIEMGGREPADAAANYDEVVAFLRLETAGRIMDWRAGDRMRGLEAADMLPAQARECRRRAGGLRRNLHRGRESGRN